MINIFIGGEVEITRAKILQLQKSYVDITSRAAEYMSADVTVRKLRFSVLCLPPALKKEHKTFVQKAKPDIKEAESVDDVFYVVGRCNYLNYSLLKYLIDLYGSNEMKEEMANYEMKIKTFRRETRLQVFSEVCEDKPDKDDENV